MEEYISHVDYKKMMENFKKGTPKNLLKESWRSDPTDEEGEEHSLAIETDLEDRFKRGEIDQQTLNNALDYVNDNDYELSSDNLGADYVLKQITGIGEGNAFTAGLAKTKHGGEFKVGDKAVKDTSNYDAPMEESGTGDEPFAGFYEKAIESASGDKISHTEEDDYGRTIYWGTKDPNVTYYMGDNHHIIRYNGETGKRYSIGNINDYDEPTHDYEPDTDADYEEPRDWDMHNDYNEGEFWEDKKAKPARRDYLKNLSPDEQTQLKEYIDSMKEIKKEITKLVGKAKQPVQEQGGNMSSGLTLKDENNEEPKVNWNWKNVSHDDAEYDQTGKKTHLKGSISGKDAKGNYYTAKWKAPVKDGDADLDTAELSDIENTDK